MKFSSLQFLIFSRRLFAAVGKKVPCVDLEDAYKDMKEVMVQAAHLCEEMSAEIYRRRKEGEWTT